MIVILDWAVSQMDVLPVARATARSVNRAGVGIAMSSCQAGRSVRGLPGGKQVRNQA